MDIKEILNYKAGKAITASGKMVDLNNPQEEDVEISDIVAALSRLPRWNGHMADWTVAHHSILVSKLCNPKHRLEALLHDAPEYLLADLAKPAKYIVGERYAELENKLAAVIASNFGLDAGNMAAIMSGPDQWALEIEAQATWGDMKAKAQAAEAIERYMKGHGATTIKRAFVQEIASAIEEREEGGLWAQLS